jgi:hypothetical protein
MAGRLRVAMLVVTATTLLCQCGGDARPGEPPLTTVKRFLDEYASRDFRRACLELDPALVRDEVRINALAVRPIPVRASARPQALRDAKRIAQTCPGSLLLWYRDVASVLPSVRRQLDSPHIRTHITAAGASIPVQGDSWELRARHGRWVIAADGPLVAATDLK